MTGVAIAPSTLQPLAMMLPQPTTITVTPQAASDAYLAAGLDGLAEGADAVTGFGATLNRAIQGAISTGHDADRKSMAAIAGKGNITDVVTAVSKAELALQSAVTIRDKVVAAYQEVMRMTI
jgi:flagellar hook-basal body complex protein FliE